MLHLVLGNAGPTVVTSVVFIDPPFSSGVRVTLSSTVAQRRLWREFFLCSRRGTDGPGNCPDLMKDEEDTAVSSSRVMADGPEKLNQLRRRFALVIGVSL